jgi:hypothetical protein
MNPVDACCKGPVAACPLPPLAGHLSDSTSVEAEAPIDLAIKAQLDIPRPTIRSVIITANPVGQGRSGTPLCSVSSLSLRLPLDVMTNLAAQVWVVRNRNLFW